MPQRNYFKITFIIVFVFSTVYKVVFQLFFGDFTTAFFLKTLAVSFTTAVVLGVLNHFLQWDFLPKNKN
jgi:hypothetical protein